MTLVPLVGAMAYYVVTPRPYYVGTDNVGVRSIVATLGPGQRLCVPAIDIPGGAAAVQLAYAAPGPVTGLTATISERGRVVAQGSLRSVAAAPGVIRLVVPVSPVLPARPQAGVGTLCAARGPGAPMAVAGFANLPSDVPSPTIGRQPIHASVAVWFLPPAGRTQSLAASWPLLMQRVALFRPGFAGSVFYWLLFLLGLPLLWYLAIRTLAVAGLPGRKVALWLALVGFLNAGFWAITTVPFDSPDESEHYAYTESIAETGRAPDAAPSARLPYAYDEVFALDAVRHFGVIEVDDTRYPWFQRDQRFYKRRIALLDPRRDNGGGYSAATAIHSPLYYSLLVPGYELGHGGGPFTELFWMRLTSALLAAIVVVAVFGTLREIAPKRPEIAVVAALLVAFHPMFSFIGGAVNNDNGVNALAAIVVYLTVRMLRRGLSIPLAIGLGASAALMPIMKGTGEALLPAVGVALVCSLALRRTKTAVYEAGFALASFIGIGALWGLVAGTFHRSLGGTASGATVATGQLGGKLTYLWEVFLPRLPFMAEHWPAGIWPFKFIYVERGFGAFGWYAIFFSHWVYNVILLVMFGLGCLALAMSVRLRATVARRWPIILFLLLVIAGVIAGVHFYYYAPTPRPIDLTPEQGRYAFTAIAPLAALAVAGLLLLSRRASIAVGTVLVTGMVGLAAASHILYLAQTFT